MKLELEKKMFLELLKDHEIRKEIRLMTKTALGRKSIVERQNLIVQRPTGLYASQRDLKIISLVFKWKVVPMFVLKTVLLKDENERTFEKRVERLVLRGLLKRVEHIGTIRFFHLTESGFLRLRNDLDGFKEEGFGSENVWHDFLTLALQLGIWAAAKPKCVELVTEQELRRFYARELPSWIPKLDSHRPDGFTHFQFRSEAKTLALEIEISQKMSERYNSVFQFYKNNPGIDFVLWLVKDKSLKNSLVEIARSLGTRSLEKHFFILLGDFKSLFWDAKVDRDQKAPVSLVELMSEMCRLDVAGLSEGCRETTFADFRKALSRC